MPAVSGKQYRFMSGACYGNIKGISKDVACDFVKKTPKDKRKLFMKKAKSPVRKLKGS